MMSTKCYRSVVHYAVILYLTGGAITAQAATATVSGQVNTDSTNQPFFNSTVSANPAGYSGSVGSNANATSTVTGTGFQRAGTSILSDLTDGNHIPLGVTLVHNVSFTVTAAQPAGAKLASGANGGLAVAGVGANNRIEAGEDLFFQNLVVTPSFIDPLGLLQPGTPTAISTFRALRSPDHDGTDSVTVSTDATQSDPETFSSATHYIPDDYAVGAITPRGTVYIKTNAGSNTWRLKGIEYQSIVDFNLAATQPATRRTFKFGDIPAAYDGQVTHNITDNDTTVTIAAVGTGTPVVLDTNEIGVGVNSPADDGAGNGERRIDGTLNESINITFDKKVSLESLTIHNYEQDGNETAILSFVSGTNPFTGQSGYSSDYTFGANSVSFKRTDVRGDTPYVITFGMGTQDDVIIEAGTTLSLTANPVTSSGLIMAMLTANVIEAAGVPGDYDNNGVVDASDYVLWRKGGPLANEVDTPGTVNAADYDAWRERFGNPNPGSGVSASAIPEPFSAALLALATFAWPLRGGRRNGQSGTLSLG